MGFDSTIQVPCHGYGGYSHLAKPDRKGMMPLKLAFGWADGRRKLIATKPKKGSPIGDDPLLRIPVVYKLEDSIRSSDTEARHEARQNLSASSTRLKTASDTSCGTPINFQIVPAQIATTVSSAIQASQPWRGTKHIQTSSSRVPLAPIWT